MDKIIVSGDSMSDVLTHGDVVWVNKNTENILRYDVVLVATHNKSINKRIVKRVVALPNETIHIVDGNVYVNGSILIDDVSGFTNEGGIANYPITLSDDEYFVLGDNRNASIDSRSELVGVVHLDDVKGKVFFRIYPLNKIGKVK